MADDIRGAVVSSRDERTRKIIYALARVDGDCYPIIVEHFDRDGERLQSTTIACGEEILLGAGSPQTPRVSALWETVVWRFAAADIPAYSIRRGGHEGQ